MSQKGRKTSNLLVINMMFCFGIAFFEYAGAVGRGRLQWFCHHWNWETKPDSCPLQTPMHHCIVIIIRQSSWQQAALSVTVPLARHPSCGEKLPPSIARLQLAERQEASCRGVLPGKVGAAICLLAPLLARQVIVGWGLGDVVANEVSVSLEAVCKGEMVHPCQLENSVRP